MDIPADHKPPRLRFIDMARSVAILLMLEGHFVDECLMISARDLDHPAYAIWTAIRRFTAPMFLTVTGLIFTYLLLRQDEQPWHRNMRVRKGSRRVLELFFWGFVVQTYAFHILECIACGLAAILVVYAVHKLLRIVPAWICFLTSALVLFSLTPVTREWPLGITWIEQGWWQVISPVLGREHPTVLFPTVPFVGFTLMGAAIGCLVRDHRHLIHEWWFPGLFAFVGAALHFGTSPLLAAIDIAAPAGLSLGSTDWIYERMGMVLMAISLLMFIDYRYGHRIPQDHLFLKVGQNTLVIYILHMVVLYGSIISWMPFPTLALNDLLHHRLGPWQAAVGATLFLAFFVILVRYLEPIRAQLSRLMLGIKRALGGASQQS
ncbi:MAG: heparan-alpha-glucosaminide N-acetyltransferase domain-containing protein [Akkermansiaceae bacterium]|nr:heparan-alpha-glucosaminide N-acetyltransferase domain-containing protein [Akkermansiaceae bacterium]